VLSEVEEDAKKNSLYFALLASCAMIARNLRNLCRELPLVGSFNHHCYGLAAADAERCDPLSLVEIVHGMNQRS
jgi:hypothetical protein